MKHRFLILIFSIALITGSCSDFFQAGTDVILESSEYIDEDNEMYAGFLGIITKMQKIGDKAIYLTDTRAEMLEPTANAPSELYELYNWNDDMTGNSYADPAGYYDVVIACNDYLNKIKAYKDARISAGAIDMKAYRQLVSGAVRIKAWVYLTMGKIYGEAVWFDDPMLEKKDISQFPLKNLDEIVAACKELLTNGFDGVDGKLSFLPNGVDDKSGFWVHYVEPTRPDDGGNYRSWNYMAPEYFALWAELCLWSGDYQGALDAILPVMNIRMTGGGGNVDVTWIQSSKQAGNGNIFSRADVHYYSTVSAISYKYMYNQTNTLLKHFDTEHPNEYLLAPSDTGIVRFTDIKFTYWAADTSDPRTSYAYSRANGKYYISKYRAAGSTVRTPYQDDVYIYIYRSCDLYFMLAEALNHLGRYAEASALINNGFGGSPNLAWTGFNIPNWTTSTNGGDRGIRGKYNRGTFLRPFKTGELNEENTKFNDLAILDEMMLEFPVEARTLPAMIRMARRYSDPEIIARLVCPKYGANAEAIRAKIMAGKYFIKWDLK